MQGLLCCLLRATRPGSTYSEGTWVSVCHQLLPGSAAVLEEAVDLLQDMGKALVLGGPGGEGALWQKRLC